MRKSTFFLIALGLLLVSSCSKKVKNLEEKLTVRTQQVASLEEQLDHLQRTNASLLDRMTDLSVISKTGAESVQQSLESLSRQYDYIEDLTKNIQTKDSINLALVMNLKRSLADIADEDLQIEVRGGVVYVSLSDRMLFRSGSFQITSRAHVILEKIARVINDHGDLDLMVEGHTDHVPINTECIADNWDLSVKRATSVVRVLQGNYSVSPDRLTAAGRGEFIPKASNQDSAGRALNRRTEIVITPRIEQFFELATGRELAN